MIQYRPSVPDVIVPSDWGIVQSVLDANPEPTLLVGIDFSLRLYNEAYQDLYRELPDAFLPYFHKTFEGESLIVRDWGSEIQEEQNLEGRFTPVNDLRGNIIGGMCVLHRRSLQGKLDQNHLSLPPSDDLPAKMLEYLEQSTEVLEEAEKVLYHFGPQISKHL